MDESRYHKTVNGISVDVDGIEIITKPILEIRDYTYTIYFKSGNYVYSSNGDFNLINKCHKELTEKFKNRLCGIKEVKIGDDKIEAPPIDDVMADLLNYLKSTLSLTRTRLQQSQFDTRIFEFEPKGERKKFRFSEPVDYSFLLTFYNRYGMWTYDISKDQYEQLKKAFYGEE